MKKIANLAISIATFMLAPMANSSTSACELDICRMSVVLLQTGVSESKVDETNNYATLPVSLANSLDFSLSTGSSDSLIGLLNFYNIFKEFTKSKKT